MTSSAPSKHIMALEAASDGGESSNSITGRGKLAAGLLGLLAVGLLMALAGFTFAASAVAFVVALPLLVLFSPVIVPGTVAIAAATLAFGVCGAVGWGGLWALKWAVGRVRGVGGDGDGSGWARTVGRAVTEAGHRVRVQERDVGGYRQREVQVKGV